MKPMRIPAHEEHLVGKVCICSIGRIGLVTGRERIGLVPGRERINFEKSGEGEKLYWVGVGFDGKGTWASERPVVVHDDPEDFRVKLQQRFGGKIGHNG